MNRYFVLAALTVAAASSLRSTLTVDPPVNLQAVTPGIQQIGHINVSGAIIGGSLNAQHATQAVFGRATAAAGVTSGGFFVGESTNSRAVYGRAASVSGFNFGGYFESPSPDGQGVFGDVASVSGVTNGVHGRTASVAGRGVYGESTSAGGASFGVYGRSTSNAGTGVFGVDTSASGTTYGVYGRAVSPSGFGVYSDGNMSASGVISGNGSGLTGVDAATIDGLDSSAFLQQIPVPLC